jgi:hypothetical protein
LSRDSTDFVTISPGRFLVNGMSDTATNGARELAFYYPNPIWSYGNWIKNLVLFFDGIALLVPDYMKERPEMQDRPIPERLSPKNGPERWSGKMAVSLVAQSALGHCKINQLADCGGTTARHIRPATGRR